MHRAQSFRSQVTAAWWILPYGICFMLSVWLQEFGGGIQVFGKFVDPWPVSMVLGSTQPLTEMSTRSISWG